jgi:hypothetical protein
MEDLSGLDNDYLQQNKLFKDLITKKQRRIKFSLKFSYFLICRKDFLLILIINIHKWTTTSSNMKKRIDFIEKKRTNFCRLTSGTGDK